MYFFLLTFSLSCRLRKKRKGIRELNIRAVEDTHKKLASVTARSHVLVIHAYPGTSEWVRRKKADGSRRPLWNASVEKLLASKLCWGWNHFYDNASLNYGCAMLAPLECFTTNTCLWCGEYLKANIPGHRYRRCPKEDCASRANQDGEGCDIEIHREINGSSNMFGAAVCQCIRYAARQRNPTPALGAGAGGPASSVITRARARGARP